MKILVCVKHVSATEGPIGIDESGFWVTVDEATQSHMNRFDEYAVEQALILKAQVPETFVDVITVGPDKAAASVRRALGMGADHGIHVLTDDRGYVTALRTAAGIARAVRERKYDLILAGVMSEDLSQGLVGPMLAEMRGMACATACMCVQVHAGHSTVNVEREIEGGCRQVLELNFPALLTVQSGINKPRYPSLSHIMRASRQELEVVSLAESEITPPHEDVLRMSYPVKNRAVVFLEGSRKDKAVQLLNILRERSLLH
jgi:electron transfer flavoprotein beta subunit